MLVLTQLPWATANEDLVELFQTTGTVEEAEMLFEGGRSKGAGVVQFATVEEAETAIAKFQGYTYGGRPLDIDYNARWKEFPPRMDHQQEQGQEQQYVEGEQGQQQEDYAMHAEQEGGVEPGVAPYEDQQQQVLQQVPQQQQQQQGDAEMLS